MEAEISFSEYLSIFVGCGTGVYLFMKMVPLLSIDGCGEIGFRVIALIALVFFAIPPLCLCSTGFKNNKRLCSFVSNFFLFVSGVDLLSIGYAV